MSEHGRHGRAPVEALFNGMPKLVKDAPADCEPFVCEHGAWPRPHVIRCHKCLHLLPAPPVQP